MYAQDASVWFVPAGGTGRAVPYTSGAAPAVVIPEIKIVTGPTTGRLRLMQGFDRADGWNGVMVAFWLDARDAEGFALDIEGALDAEDLHVTLAYLGRGDSVSAEDKQKLSRLVADFAETAHAVEARVNGFGAFTGVGDDGEDAIFLTVDSPDLMDLRAELVGALEAAGLSPDNTHAFYPHITVAYGDVDEIELPKVKGRSITLREFTAAVGDVRERHTLAPAREGAVMELQTRNLATRLSSRASVDELLADLSLPVPVVASTEGEKPDGFDLRREDWDLRRYGIYGPILNNHSWWEPTLGKGRNLRFDDKGALRADSYFDRMDPFAVLQRGKLIQEMAAISVGWQSVREGQGYRNELYEYSVVSMPMDVNAQAAYDGRSAEYALAIRSMADVETVRAYQMRQNERDLGEVERLARQNRLLREATAEEVAAWLEGRAMADLDVIKVTWERLMANVQEELAEERDADLERGGEGFGDGASSGFAAGERGSDGDQDDEEERSADGDADDENDENSDSRGFDETEYARIIELLDKYTS